MSSIKRIAVFTSGGDSPGMNAAIRSVVRTSIYHDLHVYGIYGGYDGMINGKIERLELGNVGNIMQRGGTILKTARSKEFMTVEGRQKAYDSLKAHDIDACVAIGGNGTYTGAMVFLEEHDFKIVGLPGTIDNDLYGTDYTIGFDTSVNTAMRAVDKIRDTADSHNRLFFIEVMGRHSGYIALHTALASGAADVFLPEIETNIDEVINHLKLNAKRGKLFNLIIVAEGNKSGNATELSKIVQERLPEFDVKLTIIGHLQRGGAPSCLDRVLSSRLGYSAVEALMAGKNGIAIGVVNDKIAYTPFHEAIHGVKEFNHDLISIAKKLAI
jgi:6-phosphofructokinase 1